MAANINAPQRPRPGPRGPTRRDMLAAGGAALAGALLAPAPRCAAAQPPATADGFRILEARPAALRLRGAEGPVTTLPAFAGSVPGPVLRVRKGSEIKVRLQDALSEPLAVHWHGIRGRNALDGVAGLAPPALAPGGSFDCRFAPPDAGTFWYRAHPLASRGATQALHGLLIVEEPDPPAVDRDTALLLDVWRLGADGALDTNPDGSGQPAFTANGAVAVDLPVRTNERLRLRLLNASPEVLTVRIDRHAATVMALDGQPAEPFAARAGRLRLGPGNRADLFVDALLAPGTTAPIVIETGGGEVPVARLLYHAGAPARSAPRPEPRPLPANPLPERMDFTHALKLTVRVENLIAPKPKSAGASAPPLFTVKRGRAVTLGLTNGTASMTVLHVHGHAFRLLDNLDDGWKPFWLDTLPIDAGRAARIAFVADNPGKWLLETRALGQPETGSAAWFEVT